MTDDERRLLLTVASLLAGNADGAAFRSVPEALAVLTPLEDPGDQRVLLGLDTLQKRVGAIEAHLATVPIGGMAAYDREQLATAVETALRSLAFDIRNGGK